MRRIMVSQVLIIIGAMMLGVSAWFQPDLWGMQWFRDVLAAPQRLATPTLQPGTATPAPTITVTPTKINLTPLPPTISGVVVNAKGPVAGAIVQMHGLPKQVTTSKTGAFIINGISGTEPVVLTAWSEGYYIGYTTVNPSAPDWKGGKGITITLKSYDMPDNTLYKWFSFNGVTGSASCGICHREYKEWKADAHSQSATNSRFLSMYTGGDVKGNQGQMMQYGVDGSILPPDPSKPYYGPGFKLDNPTRAGNCAACHTPLASTSPTNQNCSWSGCHNSLTIERSRGIIPTPAYPTSLKGDAGEGITCDFCHKIGEVTIDSKTRLPLPDMPGIMSMRLFRPQDGQQIFFGTLIDVPRRATNLPLITKSEYCAPCHYGVFGGVVGVGTVSGGTTIYNSYGEWLDSPYSDPKTGKTCQECHMPVSDANYFVFPEQGGLQRDYAKLHDHYMPGAADENLLKNTVTLKSSATRSGGLLNVQVSITNAGAGHDVPTDAPMRQMILVVEATDAAGNRLTLKEGPLNPAWAGNYAGQPGRTYMKVLRDEWSGEAPTGAYWRPVTVVEDTRLPALATDKKQFSFQLPQGTAANVHIQVLFRRTFQSLAQQKGWTDKDILMQEATIKISE